MIRFDKEICVDLNETRGREWLETNGLGGFASSTINGLNSRRYHGLLVAATRPPVGRIVMLSKLEETLVIGGRRFDLSANQYPGVIHPQGYLYQTGFRLDPFPVFTYEVEGIVIEKSVFMIQGENTTVVRYEFQLPPAEYQAKNSAASSSVKHPSPDILLEVRPLIAFRDYHSTTHENGALNPHVELESSRQASVQPYRDLPRLYLAHDAARLEETGQWYRSFEYEAERERGLDYVEDLFNPFVLRFDIVRAASLTLIASTDPQDISRAVEARRTEIERRNAVASSSASDDELVRSLFVAADQYIVARDRCKTIIAGYHWFGDWGRDTMIALPGLTLVTGRADVSRKILLEFARHVSEGMLPNRFPDAGETPEYNTVDATLWFFEAVRSLLQYTRDFEFVRTNLYDVLKEIIECHVRGTRYNIHVDEDGLLYAGEEGVQLTWMDAKVGERVVTPRRGKAVEIQALWYNALRIMEELARRFEDETGRTQYASMAERARRSFNQLFWNEETACLYDVVDGERRDPSVRPNQVLALSLKYPILSKERAQRVLEVVERDLLTPFGLRSLSPHDPQYRGRYEGGPASRDEAYHQGTVWAWLMGPFISAYVKVHDRSTESRGQAARWLESFRTHLAEAGLNQISEIFTGDAPHAPAGCIAQAWSVAEILRVAVEDVYSFEPVSNPVDASARSMAQTSLAA